MTQFAVRRVVRVVTLETREAVVEAGSEEEAASLFMDLPLGQEEVVDRELMSAGQVGSLVVRPA